MAREDAAGGRRLVAYLVPAAGAADRELAAGELRRYLAGRLPEVMIPAAFVTLAALPLTRNGKIDRAALPEPGAERPDLENAYVAPRTPEEQAIGAVWQAVLGQERIGIHDNFFELGGNSLLLVEVEGRLREALGREIPIVEMFRNPTIHGLAQALSAQDRPRGGSGAAAGPWRRGPPGACVDRQRQFLEDQKRRRAEQRRPGAEPEDVRDVSTQDAENPLEGIAVVGLAGRFPGADDPAELWRNLCGGVESITFYSREELAAAGVDPALLDDPRYVRASGALRDVRGVRRGLLRLQPARGGADGPAASGSSWSAAGRPWRTRATTRRATTARWASSPAWG